MNEAGYDIEKIRNSLDINLDQALANFSTQSEFITKLSAFSESSRHFFTQFNPYKISTRDESRKEFLKELKTLRTTLSSLGMTGTASDLSYLEIAAFNKDGSLLERELNEFSQRLMRISDNITAARIVEHKSPPTQERTHPKTASLADELAEKHIILAVDDMKSLLSSVVSMLLDKYIVMAVTSGKAALKVLEKHEPSLFLLDIEMPEMNGYELAAMIRSYEKFHHTPIIFLTAKNGRADVITAVQYGGNDFIVKPVDKELLLAKLKKYLP